jgi:fructokinase
MYLICGDSLFDFFLTEEEGPALATYVARAGGSPFNVAIGVARLGGKAAMLTALSTDMLGVRLRKVLEDEGVETRFAVETDKRTTLSLVGLDANGSPAYIFYNEKAADTSITEDQLPDLDDGIDGLHFGSYSIVVSPGADSLAALAAMYSDRFISLDPNIRPTIEPDMNVWHRRVSALVPHVDLLKISAEDIEALYPGRSPEALAAEWIGQGVGMVVVTDGGKSATGWLASGLKATVEPPETEVIDTVGAGDTFQAALLAELALRGKPREVIDGLDQDGLTAILSLAAKAAAITCSRRGADMPRREEL